MKFQTPLLILLVVALASGNCALGSMVVLNVDATNIGTKPFFVKTDTSGEAAFNGGVNFYVAANPQYTPGSSMHLGGASLAIYRNADFIDSNFIASCTVERLKIPAFLTNKIPPSLLEKSVLFEFTVSRNQLTNADFQIGYYYEKHPAINSYRFALQTFVPEPSLGVEVGMKNRQMEITQVLSGIPAARAGLKAGLIVRKIDGVDPVSYRDISMAQNVFKFGIVNFLLFDPATGKTNQVMLTTDRTFP